MSTSPRRNPLSAFVTTFNNARTLAACLDSVSWADEIVVLDSYSTDDTLVIAEQFGAKTYQHQFMGYGPQKQLALEKTNHHWVLLLDADEALSPALQAEIQALLDAEPDARGYEIRRLEQQFWRMPRRASRPNTYLRLFRRDCGRLSDTPVHAAPKVDGVVKRLQHPMYHYGETDIHTKIDKLNHYSTGLVADKVAKKTPHHPLIFVLYPPLYFIRSYIFKRGFLNGWIGFINSASASFYVFMKYAKLYEHYQFEKYGSDLLPEGGAPDAEGVFQGTPKGLRR